MRQGPVGHASALLARRRALVFRRLSAVYVTHTPSCSPRRSPPGAVGDARNRASGAALRSITLASRCGHHRAADNGVDQVATVVRNVDPNFSAGFAAPIAAVARGISERQVYAAGRAPQGGVAQNEWEDGNGAHVGRHERRDSTLERRRRRRGRRRRRSGGSRTGQSQRRGGQCTQSYGDCGEFLHGKPSIGPVGQGIARNPYTCYTPAIHLLYIVYSLLRHLAFNVADRR